MSGFRLAAIDLDGTLLRTDSTLSDRSRTALAEARAAGIDVVLVTARSPRSVLPIARDAGLDGLAICANGATLFDLDTETIVRHSALQAEVAHRIVRGLRERVPDIAFGWELELRFGSEPGYELQRDAARWPRPDDAYPACDVLEWSEPMTKLLARLPGADLEALLAEARELCADEATVTLTGDAFVEVMAAGVAKERALEELAAERRVAREHVVAFGDQLTDAGMLAWAGLGVAVANAHPSAFATADEVTATNDDDGVAVVLERLSRARARRSARTRP